MSSLSKWVASWFAPSRATDDDELDRFSITYQWSYEPAEHTRQASSPVTLAAGASGYAVSRSHTGPATEVQGPQTVQEFETAGIIASRSTSPAHDQLLPQQVAYTRRIVAVAEEEWWRSGQLPSRDALRRALGLLAAGYPLEQSQLPLLLRTSLHFRRGVLTALHYQTDPECTALILAEAITKSRPPLPLDDLVAALRSDPASPHWRHLLARELQTAYLSQRDEAARVRIAAALDVLVPPPAMLATNDLLPVAPDGKVTLPRVALAVLVIGALLAFAIGAVWAMSGRATADGEEVRIAGDASGSNLGYTLLVDRTEVTNAEYRRCYRGGACAWPAETKAAGIEDYFREAAYLSHPVVNVDQRAAADYCNWNGKRLPSATEWRTAAGISPITGRAYRYPWGDSFGRTLANSLEAAIGQPQQVGSYHPAGDSSIGTSDMAGNVAEWTSTPGEEQGTFIVAGGSYRDPSMQLAVDAQKVVSGTVATDWLGFRCVRPSR